MSSNPSKKKKDYLSDDIYADLLTSMQEGDWEGAIKKVAILQSKYDNPKIDTIYEEIKLRLSIDSEEIDETISLKKEKDKTTARSITLLVIGIIAAYFAIIFISTVIEERILITEEAANIANIEKDIKLSIENAEKYLAVGLYEDAIPYLEYIISKNPDEPQLKLLQAEVDKQISLSDKYLQAMDLITNEDIEGALEVLYDIQSENSFYKDVDYQINTLERQFMLFGQIDAGNSYYNTGDWDKAIIAYETFLGFNPNFEEENIKNKLFDSYIYVIEEILSRENLSLNELEEAESLYRKSVSLRPQDADTIDQRATIYNSIVDLLVDKYIFLARETLVDAPDSLKNISDARSYLSKALIINPNSASLHLEFTILDKYLRGVASFNSNLYDEAIISISYVYDADHGYANNTAGQILYESYIAKGKFWAAVGDYLSALENFQQAFVISNQYPEKNLMSFEAQTFLAFTFGRLGEYQKAAQLYSNAVSDAKIRNYARELETIFLYAIDAAESNITIRNYQTAYFFYEDALSGTHEIYTLNQHTVEQSDYIVLLANQYNSTITYILDYNELASINLIRIGQEILIPSLP